MTKSATQLADIKRRKLMVPRQPHRQQLNESLQSFQTRSAQARNRHNALRELERLLDDARQVARMAGMTDIGDNITDVMIELEEVTS